LRYRGFAGRVPELNKEEMTQLASIGALNSIGAEHRRNALWRASEAVRRSTELLVAGWARTKRDRGISRGPGGPPPIRLKKPLRQMNSQERLVADYQGIGMTIGRHPMARVREEMNRLGVIPAAGLAKIPNGRQVRVAGNVIVRQRPGTAKGVVFFESGR